jgi:iron complex transport system substrate-binding protein
LYKLGVGNQIVGVTHECKYPAAAKRKPRVIHPSFDPSGMSGRQIDNTIVSLMRSGKDIYIVDEKKLKKAGPDLIVAQGLCEVCSPFTKEISRAVNLLDDKPDVLVLDPRDLDDILVSIMDIAEKVGRVKQGRRLVSLLQTRIDSVRAIKTGTKPKVMCIEWVDPFFTAGHWVPQMVEYAGGINGISMTGEPSRRLEIDKVVDFDPDIVIMMPCGFGIKRTLDEMKVLDDNEKWTSLRAVRGGNVYVVDAGSYFSKPSPRTVTGLEILAKIINPKEKIKVPASSFRRITG